MTSSFRRELGFGFSPLALAKLKSSGIPIEVAAAAGLFSVDDAKVEVHQEFLAAPALVFPYFDLHGDPIYFERDGEMLEFLRLRYLADPPARGFLKQTPQRYAQHRASGVQAYFPQVRDIDWPAFAADPAVNLVITEGELKAISLCARGLAAIGIGGVDCFLCRQEQEK